MKLQKIDHINLVVRDLQKTCDFYHTVLGMKVLKLPHHRFALKFGRQKINLYAPDQAISLGPVGSHSQPGTASFCFLTTTPLEKIILHLKKSEVSIVEGPIRKLGANSPILSVYIHDPDQNLIEISNEVPSDYFLESDQSPFFQLPVLETPRLRLRPVSLSDMDDIFEYAHDTEVTRYTSWENHKTKEDTKTYIETVLERYEKGEASPWAVEHKESHTVIGTAGFSHWRLKISSATMGYALSKHFWNQGLMTEAVREIIGFGFQHMDLNRIQAYCDIENDASARVMEKSGMAFEGILRDFCFLQGVPHSVKMYAILKKDFNKI